MWVNRASTIAWSLARAAVCEWALRCPDAVLPPLRATIGLRWDTARATRAKRTGSPNDSRYSRITVDDVVVGPQAQQVVAADVDLVAHRHERGDAGVAPVRLGGDGDPHPARLRGDGDAAGAERLVGEGGVQAAGRRDHAEAVRPDEAHAVAAGGGEQLVLHAGAVGTRLGEARRRGPRRCAHPWRRSGRPPRRPRRPASEMTARSGTSASSSNRIRIDDADATGEGLAEVGEHPSTRRRGVVAGADHDDVGRLDDRAQGTHRRLPVAQVGVVLQDVVVGQVELDAHDAVLEPDPVDEADGAEHARAWRRSREASRRRVDGTRPPGRSARGPPAARWRCPRGDGRRRR